MKGGRTASKLPAEEVQHAWATACNAQIQHQRLAMSLLQMIRSCLMMASSVYKFWFLFLRSRPRDYRFKKKLLQDSRPGGLHSLFWCIAA